MKSNTPKPTSLSIVLPTMEDSATRWATSAMKDVSERSCAGESPTFMASFEYC